MSTANDAFPDAQNSTAIESGRAEIDAQTPPTRTNRPWLWLLFLAAVNLLGPFLPIPNAPAALLGTIAFTVVYVGGVIAFALGVARRKLSIGSALIWLGISALAWIAVVYGAFPLVRGAIRATIENGTRPETALRFGYLALLPTLQSLALLCVATFAGSLLARLIRYPNMLGPIGAAVALIDIWGVLFGGIVSQLLTNKATQPIAAKAMTAGPKLGAASAARTGYSIELPAIGVGDFLFIALFLSVLVNLAMNWRTSARLMWVLVSLALLSIQLLPFVPFLPGLLFIGAAAVLPNWKYFIFTREERFALLYSGIFVLILTVGLYFGFSSALAKTK